MDDIDFLSSEGEEDKKKDEGKHPEKDEMQMHVPEAAEEEPGEKDEAGFLSDMLSSGKEEEKESKGDAGEEKAEHPEPPKPVVDRKVATPKPRPTEPKPEMPAPAPTPPPPKPSTSPPPPEPEEPAKPEKEEDDGGDILRVSLLATEEGGGLTDQTVRQRVRTFLIVMALALALDGLIYGGILFYRSRVMDRIQTIEAGVEDLDESIAAAEDRIVPAREYQRLTRLGRELVASHVHWTNLLKLIEDLTATQVRFMNLSGAETGTVTANIVAKDYTTIARQLVALRQSPAVTSAEIGTVSASFGEEGLIQGAQTTLTLEIDGDVFLASVAEEEEQE